MEQTIQANNTQGVQAPQTATTVTEKAKADFPNAGIAQPNSPDLTQVNKPKNLTASEIMKRTSDMPKDPSEETSYSSQDIEKIQDPMAKKIAQDIYKNFERGYQKKFQDLAGERRRLDEEKQRTSQWTPERLQQEMSRQDFVQAAQLLQQSQAPSQWQGSQDEWTETPPEQKQEFLRLNQRVSVQEAQLNKMLQAQEDEKLKTVYPDYNPNLVNQLKDDLITGRYQATSEDIWKVANFQTAVERAYQLGMQDGRSKLDEKRNAMGMGNGYDVRNPNSLPENIDKKDLGSIARFRLQQFKNGK